MKTFMKWASRVVTGTVLLFFLLSAVMCFMQPGEPPETEWGVQTYTNDQFRIPSRYYYGDSIEYIDGYPVLKGSWWSYDGKKYHKHKGDKEFPVSEYGKVDVIRRK